MLYADKANTLSTIASPKLDGEDVEQVLGFHKYVAGRLIDSDSWHMIARSEHCSRPGCRFETFV